MRQPHRYLPSGGQGPIRSLCAAGSVVRARLMQRIFSFTRLGIATGAARRARHVRRGEAGFEPRTLGCQAKR